MKSSGNPAIRKWSSVLQMAWVSVAAQLLRVFRCRLAFFLQYIIFNRLLSAYWRQCVYKLVQCIVLKPFVSCIHIYTRQPCKRRAVIARLTYGMHHLLCLLIHMQQTVVWETGVHCGAYGMHDLLSTIEPIFLIQNSIRYSLRDIVYEI